MTALVDALADAAFGQYAAALARAAQVPGHQFDLLQDEFRVAREWHGIFVACVVEGSRRVVA